MRSPKEVIISPTCPLNYHSTWAISIGQQFLLTGHAMIQPTLLHNLLPWCHASLGPVVRHSEAAVSNPEQQSSPPSQSNFICQAILTMLVNSTYQYGRLPLTPTRYIPSQRPLEPRPPLAVCLHTAAVHMDRYDNFVIESWVLAAILVGSGVILVSSMG